AGAVGRHQTGSCPRLRAPPVSSPRRGIQGGATGGPGPRRGDPVPFPAQGRGPPVLLRPAGPAPGRDPVSAGRGWLLPAARERVARLAGNSPRGSAGPAT